MIQDQISQSQRGAELNRQNPQSVGGLLLKNRVLKRNVHLKLAELLLDLDFPSAGHAEDKQILGILADLQSPLGHLGGSAEQPEGRSA